MNREIKFRGLRIYTNIWDYGFYHADSKGDYICDFEGIESCVHPESVGQFTGLKDLRNNRGIYEGDIYFEEVETDEGDVHLYLVCTWINERAAFAWLSKGEYINYIDNGFDAIEGDFDGMYFELNASDIDKLHYAGNIYEHSHLIQKGESHV